MRYDPLLTIIYALTVLLALAVLGFDVFILRP